MQKVQIARVRGAGRHAALAFALVVGLTACHDGLTADRRPERLGTARPDPTTAAMIATEPPGLGLDADLGTDGAQRLILDSLDATPWLAFHWSDSDSSTAGTIVIVDRAGGTEWRIRPEPAFTIRHVDGVRVDLQDDSTAIVVLLLHRGAATAAFVDRYLAGDHHGVFLVNGRVLRGGPGHLFDDSGEIPVPIALLRRDDAERLAERLRAARLHFRSGG